MARAAKSVTWESGKKVISVMPTARKELTREEFQTLAHAIGKAMAVQTGEPWTVNFEDSTDWNPYFNLCWQGKKRIWCKIGWNKPGMLTAFTTMEPSESSHNNYSWEYDKLRRESTTSINISVERTPEAVAKDIIKRLLPTANALVAASKIDRENETKRETYQQQVVSKLTAALGEAGEYRDGNSGHSPYFNVSLGDDGYGDVMPSVYSDGNCSVKVELRSISLETAIAVCKALATIKGKQ